MTDIAPQTRRDKSLAVVAPHMMAYWDYTLNIKDPYVVGAKSNRPIWWKCLDKEGHVWEKAPDQITKLSQVNCPYCTLKRLHKDNSLLVRFPFLSEEFNSKRNGVSPDAVIGNSSSKKYWWICKEKHEWYVALANRTRLNSGCPACYGRVAHDKNNLALLYPEIAKELDVVKTGKEASEFVGGSDIHVWWICSAKKHEWKTAISTRTKLGSGCPYCTNQKINSQNSLATLFPKIAKEFDTSKNTMTANEVGAGALKWVWWKCSKGHQWESAISNRTSQNLGCPKCSRNSTSNIENLFRLRLKETKLFDSVEDFPFKIKMEKDKRKYLEIDILVTLDDLKIAIEYDGSYFHNKKIEKDIEKTKNLIELGYLVIRIREQTKHLPLEFLDYRHDNFIQMKHQYSAQTDDITESMDKLMSCLKKKMV